jgi:hypothetical protein
MTLQTKKKNSEFVTNCLACKVRSLFLSMRRAADEFVPVETAANP